jgi:hypothetical protein
MAFLRSLRLHLVRGLCNIGTPGSPPTRLTTVPDKWVHPTRRPADLTVGPTDLIGGPYDLLKTFQKIPRRPYPERPQDLACKTRHQWIPTKQIDEYGKCCNQLDLGLLVITDQESRNRPCLMANRRRARQPFYNHAILKQSTPTTRRRVLLSRGPNQYKVACSLCSVCSCATYEFLALDSTSPNN